MVTQRQIGAGVGAGSLGVIAGEGLQQAGERGIVTERRAALAAAGVGGAALWAAVLAEFGVFRLSDTQQISLGSFGAGEVAWFAARRLERAPKLTIEIPETVNLASPIINSAVFGLVGAGVATAAGLVT